MAAPIRDLQVKIKRHIASKGIRMSEFFRDYDKHHRGFISTSQFTRCFQSMMQKSSTHDQLTNDEVTVLAAWYQLHHPGLDLNDSIRWIDFCKNIQGTFEC